MKKIISIILSLLLSYNIFSYDFSLTSIETEGNTVSTYRGKSIQTVSNENYLISMLATKNSHGIQFSTSITNYSENGYLFKESCISVYQGIYEHNNWEKIEYIPATEYFEKEKTAAKTEEVLSAVVLGLSAVGAGYSRIKGTGYVNGHRYTYTTKVYSPADATIATANSYVALDNLQQNNQEYLTYLESNLLFDSLIQKNENYNGIFVVDEEKGPDYKVIFEISSSEKFEFCFTRSDKDEILNPWKDKKRDRHSIIAAVSPTLNHFGAYYLWSRPKGIGIYGGMTFQKKSSGIKTFGDISFGTFDNPEPIGFGYPDPLNTSYGTFYDWKFDYDKSSYNYDSFGMFAGLTIKTFPNTWILAGIGMDTVFAEYYEGDLYYKYNRDYKTATTSWTYYNHCWLKDNPFSIKFAPQIGINFITNHLDIGCIATIPIKGKFSIDITAGIAF